MKNKKPKQTLFGLQIANNKRVHELSVALNMVGLQVNMEMAELIQEAIDAINLMGSDFDLSTAVDIKLKVDEKYAKILDEFNKK